MFDLQIPWWELVVRAAIVYVALLVMVRLTGKRTVGQFTPFDLLVIMLLSEAVSDSLRGGDESLTGGLIVAVTLVLLDVGIALTTARSRKLDAVLQGSPVLIGRDGVIYKDVLKQQRVPEADMDKALRSADCALEDMRMAILEADGSINIMKRQS
ncbi:MAG: YetF domain-containing protein [Pseudomonadota bacterium]